MAFFLISSLFLGFLDHLQIFWPVVSDRSAKAFNMFGATWTAALDITKAFDRVHHVVILYKLKFYRIFGQIFGAISSFVRPFWVVLHVLCKNIPLIMVEFLKGPFLVMHFSYYTWMTFLMMLSVIMLYMLMILLSTVSVIWHLVCGNSWNWLLNLNLICGTLVTGAGIGLLISVLEKLI